jgi:hypothetical protein
MGWREVGRRRAREVGRRRAREVGGGEREKSEAASARLEKSEAASARRDDRERRCRHSMHAQPDGPLLHNNIIMAFHAILFTMLLLIVMIISLDYTTGLSQASKSSSTPTRENARFESSPSLRRRQLLVKQSASTFAFLLSTTSPALALQEKNEALCNTGFFTNIWQYKCTDLGDIEDEGKSRKLSSSEESATESLMSKLMMDETRIVGAPSSGEISGTDSIDPSSESGRPSSAR